MEARPYPPRKEHMFVDEIESSDAGKETRCLLYQGGD